MKGWKSKVGAIVFAFGGGLIAGSKVAPSPEIEMWLMFIGTILASSGTALLGVGIAHKIEKQGK